MEYSIYAEDEDGDYTIFVDGPWDYEEGEAEDRLEDLETHHPEIKFKILEE